MKIRGITFLILITLFTSCDEKASEGFVKIHNRQQHVLDLGEGKPVVIFLSGRGDVLTSFDKVQGDISKVTRTFSYDRAGLGKSESLDTVRTFDNMIKELNSILESENVKPPYILVGHSLGGFIARYYYHLHRERVAGLVLIDPGHEDDIPVLLSLKNEKERRVMDSILHTVDPSWPAGLRNEIIYSEYNDKLMKGILQPADIPVTLFISVKWNEVIERDYLMTRKDVEVRAKLMTDWANEIGAKIYSTENSGHFIHREEPELVKKEILNMVETVRSNSRRSLRMTDMN